MRFLDLRRIVPYTRTPARFIEPARLERYRPARIWRKTAHRTEGARV